MADLILYRALRPAFAFAPLSGAGAAVAGGRWNARGAPALYLAGDPMTALAEYNQDLLFRPVTLAQYRVRAAKLADLTDADFRRDRQIDDATLRCEWYRLSLEQFAVPSWLLAAELAEDGYHGVRYPSRINGATCVCLWRWNEAGGCKVAVSDLDSRLPKDNRSWGANPD